MITKNIERIEPTGNQKGQKTDPKNRRSSFDILCQKVHQQTHKDNN